MGLGCHDMLGLWRENAAARVAQVLRETVRARGEGTRTMDETNVRTRSESGVGLRAVTLPGRHEVEVLDAELRQHGSSLEEFAARHGMMPVNLIWMIVGKTPERPEVMFELRELVGDPYGLLGRAA